MRRGRELATLPYHAVTQVGTLLAKCQPPDTCFKYETQLRIFEVIKILFDFDEFYRTQLVVLLADSYFDCVSVYFDKSNIST